MKATDWLKTSGNVIAYYPKLAKPLGSVNAAILFGQLFYWQDKATSELGVYKTQEDIENETGLSRREQESARKNLRDRGILIETHKRLEHRLYFKLDLDKFNEMMEEYATVSQCNNAPPANGGNSQPPMAETDIREATKPPFVIQEITTENTTEITTQDNHLNPPAGQNMAKVLRDEIADLVEGKFNSDNAKELHDDVEQLLKFHGFSVEREYLVDDRGDGYRGRVDLVVERDGVKVGVELDFKNPRKNRCSN
ncbi:hypothetical protein HPC37_04515 [Pasteurellaceae bacterium 20609_3]|uniref:hypothetical protein n=1 Tax=Spirabiliibacterium mucosae TaxID=28156 RepID=UPI001AADF0E9|nr:hypothetical protein [Spirabiliibacterium mucosae]MBE2898105.1 hypothetical protein [Spirabiliibacterium mucosae]